MATGIEMMFSKMIGLSPEQLKNLATGFVDSVNAINSNIADIKKQVDEIHAATVGVKKDDG